MLIKDDSCIAEQTILRYQSNSVSELLGSDWYGILLRNPNGDTVVDTFFNVSGVEDGIILDFARESVSYEFLQSGSSELFTYRNSYFYVYPIRRTNKGYIVFFLFYRKDTPFQDRDIRWYKTYAQAAYQRTLLENELVQVRNYNNAILQNADCAVVVADKKYRVLSANASGEKFFGASRLQTENFRDASELTDAIQDVLANGGNRCIPQLRYLSREDFPDHALLRVSVSPLRTSKGVVSAVILIATDISSTGAAAYIAAKKQQNKEIENIYLGYVNDIRPPLMNIRGCAELLKNSTAQNAAEQKLVEYIIEETDKIESLNKEVEVFRDINQPESFERSDLNTVLFNCATIAGRLRAMKQVDIQLHISDEKPLLAIESSDLYVALLTILQNLVESASPDGQICISSRFSRHLKLVKLEISCVGEVNHDFQFESDIVVSNIIRQYKGTVSVLRKADKGIEYAISLPTL